MKILRKFGCDLVTDVSFEKQELKHCDPLGDKYGNYPTLKLAQAACSVDINCKAVFDDHCHRGNEFYLCPTTSTLESSQHSCVYEKSKQQIALLTYIYEII